MSKVKMQIRDADLAKVETALRRAAARAKKIAEETNTPLVVYEGGRVLKKFPGKQRASKRG
ncbi:MAG TPA: hypothetical protein VFG09_00355 [Thermodesulfovibrionales bacterium]|nr:hypothetical protein [Thermodesulfovibrionales bacterium]